MISFLAENLWALWTALALVFLVVEVATTALVSMWFVPAAVITAILSIFCDNFLVQVIAFLVLSLVFLILCKKFYRVKTPKKLGEANELLIGKNAVAQTDIDSINGKVSVGDIYWRAVSDEPIESGSNVKITDVNGTVLTVVKL